MIRYHALHDLRRYTVPRCWAPHAQTQMHGVLISYLAEDRWFLTPTRRTRHRGARADDEQITNTHGHVTGRRRRPAWHPPRAGRARRRLLEGRGLARPRDGPGLPSYVAAAHVARDGARTAAAAPPPCYHHHRASAAPLPPLLYRRGAAAAPLPLPHHCRCRTAAPHRCAAPPAPHRRRSFFSLSLSL